MREARVASELDALIGWFGGGSGLPLDLARSGSGALSH